MPTLFDPLPLGDLTLKNRIIMAPLTRCRASQGRVPNDLMAQYYAQRAEAGLILSEATSVTPMGVGYPDTPGLWSQEQVEGWKKVTSAVHKKGGLIFAQLWHVGRISSPDYLDGETPVSASAVRPKGHVSLIRPMQDYVTPRALELSEIPTLIEAYRKGAMNAQMAGFDGVELHAANGYLIDQFLQDSTNQRTDEYGGSRENRARLLLEATDAIASVFGPELTGVHIAPRGDANDMGDSDPWSTFSYVVHELNERGIAFIFAREHQGEGAIGPRLKKLFNGAWIANEAFTKDSAEAALKAGDADAVAWGKAFIANPDLVTRLRQGAPLNELDPTTLYQTAERGYIDYPELEAVS
jgi:2,4-dienoyl-CoA reductase-like NADH-dependent reductase (Old Yellow Enzyme family)